MQMTSRHSWLSVSFATTLWLSSRWLTRRGVPDSSRRPSTQTFAKNSVQSWKLFSQNASTRPSSLLRCASSFQKLCLKTSNWNKVWGNIKEDLCRFGIYAVLRDPYSKVVGNEGGEGLHKFGMDRVDSNHHFFCDWHQDWILFTPAFDLKICFELFHITFSFASLLK